MVADAEAALSKNIAASQTVVYNIKYAAAGRSAGVLTRLVPNLIVTPGPTQGFTPARARDGGRERRRPARRPPTARRRAGGDGDGGDGQRADQADHDLAAADRLRRRHRPRPADSGQVDVRPAQINYEAKVTEINLNYAKNLGLNYDFSGATTTHRRDCSTTPTNVDQRPTLGDNGYRRRKILKFGTFGRTADLQLRDGRRWTRCSRTATPSCWPTPNISARGRPAGRDLHRRHGQLHLVRHAVADRARTSRPARSTPASSCS